ncbi:hypothetical protein RJT34_16148 [Clitoria ternatea]|uniref:ABC transporter domain-containing protein n=1 Tax=Clitoria ternatea TaxID=43366 RepID=A0AAN9PC15_CLITE
MSTVALVGESGSGKSTVISLLQRFYEPDSGYITVDGIEIQKLQVKWLRQQMGVVSQEPVLFNDTIRANIAYGKGRDATEAEIIAAAEMANAHKFISSLQQILTHGLGMKSCPNPLPFRAMKQSHICGRGKSLVVPFQHLM